jgi:hypothetical protein
VPAEAVAVHGRVGHKLVAVHHCAARARRHNRVSRRRDRGCNCSADARFDHCNASNRNDHCATCNWCVN